MNVSSLNLKTMSVDKLTALREQVDAVLSSKVADERRNIQDQLSRLDHLAGTGARAKGTGRGSRGVVAPKYRNPENLTETWAGRGLKPRWLSAALKAGNKLEDFSVEAPQTKKRGRPRKAG
jgi:DNA-binding protein H-NS